MKIVVCARVLNEHENILDFLRGYEWADRIVLSDGGSTDGTLNLLYDNPKIRVVHFTERLACPKDASQWMNPENAHHNFLMQNVMDEMPDWIVYDDVDCYPNYILRESARWLLETFPGNTVNAVRLYVWMRDSYFPKLNEPGPSLWAWKPRERDLIATGQDPFSMEYTFSGDRREMNLDLPMCLLHQSWPTPEAFERKWARYASWGRPQRNPIEAWGQPQPLPEWAHD